MTYKQLLERKAVKAPSFGIEPRDTSPALFDFQKRAAEFAIRKGRAALFCDTGMGKTITQLEWARQMPGRKLILCPPAVAPQTVREAQERLGLDVVHDRTGESNAPIVVTNYERLHHFNAADFSAVVLDESSILKSFMGRTKQTLCDTFANYPYRLACTATPAPNDYMELGNHSAFLGIMPANEMLSRWFINDTMNFGCYRLKGHAVQSFWQWVASWAVCASKPSDLGGDDTPFILPKLTTRLHVVETGPRMAMDGDQSLMFGAAELSATDIHKDKRQTLKNRITRAAELVNHSEPAIVWCETNDESEALANAIPDSVEVKGSDSIDAKEDRLDQFSRGQVRVIITKPSIAGFGLNWQHCAHVVFASLSFSFESFYQAIRRSWRFGQKRPVNVDVIIADSEQGIWRSVREKMDAHDEMKSAMRLATIETGQTSIVKQAYAPTITPTLPSFLRS